MPSTVGLMLQLAKRLNIQRMIYYFARATTYLREEGEGRHKQVDTSRVLLLHKRSGPQGRAVKFYDVNMARRLFYVL